MTKPLYEALKGEEKEPLQWNRECEQDFEPLKIKLDRAPASGLPYWTNLLAGILMRDWELWGL